MPASDPRGPNDPDFGDGALADLLVSDDAYVWEAYAAGVRHEFRDLVGENQDQQAYVVIQAPGVVVNGATNVHFEVETASGAPEVPCQAQNSRPRPRVELNGTFANCTFQLEKGTLVNGVAVGEDGSFPSSK